MPDEQSAIEQEKIEKILSHLYDVFDNLDIFAREIDVSSDDILKSLAFCIGVSIAQRHWHFFRNNRQQTVRYYQGWIQTGMEHGWQELKDQQREKENCNA